MSAERALLALALLGTCCALPQKPPAATEAPSQADRADALLNSTVRISDGLGAGAGFFVGPGLVITAGHVIMGVAQTGRPMEVRMRDGRTCAPLTASVALDYDLGFIWVDGCDDAPTLELAPGDPRPGTHLMAAGHPLIADWVVEDGIVSNPDVDMAGNDHLMQMSVPINGGMSGGPVADDQNRVVGVVMGLYSKDGMYAGISFAVPVSILREQMALLTVSGAIDAVTG